MKKVIDGKLYDTDTAKKIGYYDNGASYNDFDYVCETLYRKRTGEYFIHGDGGAMSRYAVHQDSNHWGGGQKIIPLAYDDAKEWAEKNLDADTYQQEFGEVTEGETDTIVVKLPAAIGSKLRTAAKEQGKTITAMVTELIGNM